MILSVPYFDRRSTIAKIIETIIDTDHGKFGSVIDKIIKVVIKKTIKPALVLCDFFSISLAMPARKSAIVIISIDGKKMWAFI